MKAPLSWLKDYVDIDCSAEELKNKLFSCGFEVEEMVYVAKHIEKIVTCKILEIEKQKLIKLEQGVKVLEKHKEKSREAYLAEEKAAELKQYSELGVTRFFRQSQERAAEEEAQLLKQLKELDS